MATPCATLGETLEQQRLRALYLTAMRKRFKAEINRFTSGAMADRLSGQSDVADLNFLMSYVHGYHWLRHNVHEDYRAELLEPFVKTKQGFLMRLLHQSPAIDVFLRGYIEHWVAAPAEAPIQRNQCLALLASAGGDPDRLISRILALWGQIDPFTSSYAVAYRDLARDERARYAGLLGPEDQQRLALVDALPNPPEAVDAFTFPKLGLIPAMGCPQTCRHCMFIWRPLMKDTPDPQPLLDQVNRLTRSVLFTGGDLSRKLDSFYQAMATMSEVSTFAILLNGDFADNPEVTRATLDAMAAALNRRPRHWAPARVLLQISFDEFHQEVVIDRHGRLKERIPIYKIANIVEAAPRYGDKIQLCLLHKQNALNFSMDLFKQGVVERLVSELGERGHRVEILSAAPSSRTKRNPLKPEQTAAPVVKDASFVLSRYPNRPILFTSSTIDAFGRAQLLDETEAVRERDLLQQLLNGHGAGGETFDIDLMFWFNGWATLFSAVHICLGNVYDDGMETVLRRQRKDPLSRALQRFDLRLLDFYRERADDLDEIIARSTGPHHLFHTITEQPAMRLHMTERLLAA